MFSTEMFQTNALSAIYLWLFRQKYTTYQKSVNSKRKQLNWEHNCLRAINKLNVRKKYVKRYGFFQIFIHLLHDIFFFNESRTICMKLIKNFALIYRYEKCSSPAEYQGFFAFVTFPTKDHCCYSWVLK